MRNLFLIFWLPFFLMNSQNIKITYLPNLITIHDFSLKKNQNPIIQMEKNTDNCSNFEFKVYNKNKIKVASIEQIPILDSADRANSFIYGHKKQGKFDIILYSNEYITIPNNFHNRLIAYLLLVNKENNSYVQIHDTFEDSLYPPKLLTYFVHDNYFLVVRVENYAYDQAETWPTGEDYYYEIVKIDEEKGLIKLDENQNISIMNKYFRKKLEDFYYRKYRG